MSAPHICTQIIKYSIALMKHKTKLGLSSGRVEQPNRLSLLFQYNSDTNQRIELGVVSSCFARIEQEGSWCIGKY